MKKILGAALTFALLTAGSASASTITIFSAEDLSTDGFPAAHGLSDAARTAFFSSVPGLGVENFDSLSAVPGNPRTATALNLNFVAGGPTGSLTDFQGNCDTVFTPCGYVTDLATTGRQAISGKNYYVAENAVGFEVGFNQFLSAFGFYATDVGDKGGQIQLSLYDGASLLHTFPLIGSHDTAANGNLPAVDILNGGVLYFGFSVSPDLYFNRVTFGNVNTFVDPRFNDVIPDVFGFDDFAAQAAPVPEPTSIVLLGTGVIAAIAARRRRSKRSAE